MGPFGRGRRHRRLLEGVDLRIAVSGIRGKSSTTRRLHDVFYERGYDTLAKITGDFPLTVHNGVEEPIARDGRRVTLYENERVLGEFLPRLFAEEPKDVLVAENQAITEYTMRMVNERFVRPHVILLTNIRQDHNDTLGKDRQTIARSFARSIPAGTHVVSGEQHPVIHDYLAAELERRDATLTQVEVPEEHRSYTGAETVYAIDEILRFADEPPLDEERRLSLLGGFRPDWLDLGDGLLFNAAKVNEIESTELFRRHLAGDAPDARVVCPFVFLRRDRRGRSASFAEYADILHDRGLIDRVHVAGAGTGAFARAVDPPATEHDIETTAPETVLDRLLATGQPVVLMANTVHPFMRRMREVVDARTVGTVPGRMDGGD
ncbi:Mur ligase [Halomarina litorea]|uniref:Mur ligase n=1 Tax=Halomarina litorea TaxID=2961595 RepID=UPI0020C56E76|nr:Mur ligase [Halomarina sp. BCD28]